MNLLQDQPSTMTIALLLLVGVAILTFAMRARRRAEGDKSGVSTPARVCLVLLRIAIGWHFLVEGIEKLHTPNWSSEGYLREASGPLAPMYRDLAGDSLVVLLTSDGQTVSPELADEWQRYLSAYTRHYFPQNAPADETPDAKANREKALDDFRAKSELILADVKQHAILVVDTKAKTTSPGWLVAAKPISIPAPNSPPIVKNMTMTERLAEYEKLKKKVAEAEAKLPEEGRKGWPKWSAAKAEAAKWRTELKQDLDAATADFKGRLDKLLSMEQHYRTKLLDETPTKKLEPVERSMDWSNRRQASDAVVKYGLVVVGIGLIAGCFTRLAAVAGALLLLSFYLAMPALPYLPESPKAEGHYLYVNKNIIEMLALLALAGLPTGRWAGVDGLLQFVNPFNWQWKKKKPAASTVVPMPPPNGDGAAVGQAFQPAEPAKHETRQF